MEAGAEQITSPGVQGLFAAGSGRTNWRGSCNGVGTVGELGGVMSWWLGSGRTHPLCYPGLVVP